MSSRQENPNRPGTENTSGSTEKLNLPPIEFNPDYVAAIHAYNRFLALSKSGSDDKAQMLHELSETLRLNPNYITALFVRPGYLVETGQYLQAALDVLHAMEITTEHTNVMYGQTTLAMVRDKTPFKALSEEDILTIREKEKEIFRARRFAQPPYVGKAFQEAHLFGDYDAACAEVKTLGNSEYEHEYIAAFEAAYGLPWYK